MARKLRSPFGWFGGKYYLAPKLLQYVPPHKYYAEVFGGAANLLIAKPPAEFEVYNDIDSDLVNFFRVLRDKEKMEELVRMVYMTPYSREIFYECVEKLRNAEWKDDVERAYLFYIGVKMSFGGKASEPAWGSAVTTIRRRMPSAVSRYLSSIELLPEIHARFMRVQIENKDFRDFFETYIARWNYEEAFVYLDPPYLPETRKSGKYRFEMSTDEHEELLELLFKHSSNAKFMLSGYDNKLYKKLEDAGWIKKCWKMPVSAVGRTRQTKLLGEGALDREKHYRIDCIWMNYELPSFSNNKLDKLFENDR